MEEVKREFAAQSKEVEKEKEEREALESKLEDAEKERKKLRRQVTSLEADIEELRNREGGNEAEPSNHDEQEIDLKRLKELEDNMRLKNKQIHQLLEDIEHLEKDNESYQERISSLRDELSEATRQITLITGEFVALKNSFTDSKNLLDTLQKDNSNLKLKLEDQFRDKARRDKQIEEISVEVDSKVDEMRSICNYKDAQIEELRSRLNRAVVSSGSRADTEASRQNIAVLSKAIKERDEQIEKMQDQLKHASK